MKHTPGPWQFTTNMYGIDNMQVYGVEDKNGPSGVANCGYGEGSEANARLIAAAPELLEACQAYVAIYGHRKEHLSAHAMKLAIAAIAKATGVEQ